MPIYEFYCPACHMVFSFLARSMNNSSVPACPKCNRKKLDKKVSRFAISKGLKESDSTPDPFENIDEAKMEQLMAEMAPHLDENSDGPEDPRQMASLMKKMFDMTGMQPNDSMLEAMRRMEAAGAIPLTVKTLFYELRRSVGVGSPLSTMFARFPGHPFSEPEDLPRWLPLR